MTEPTDPAAAAAGRADPGDPAGYQGYPDPPAPAAELDREQLLLDVELLGGATAGGLPWPATTDPLQQGANDIKALAAALDTRGWANRMEARKVNVTCSGGVGSVNFATAFKSAPMVIWSPGSPFGSSDLVLTAGLYSTNPITATGFALLVRQVSPTPSWYAGPLDVYYFAIGPSL